MLPSSTLLLSAVVLFGIASIVPGGDAVPPVTTTHDAQLQRRADQNPWLAMRPSSGTANPAHRLYRHHLQKRDNTVGKFIRLKGGRYRVRLDVSEKRVVKIGEPVLSLASRHNNTATASISFMPNESGSITSGFHNATLRLDKAMQNGIIVCNEQLALTSELKDTVNRLADSPNKLVHENGQYIDSYYFSASYKGENQHCVFAYAVFNQLYSLDINSADRMQPALIFNSVYDLVKLAMHSYKLNKQVKFPKDLFTFMHLVGINSGRLNKSASSNRVIFYGISFPMLLGNDIGAKAFLEYILANMDKYLQAFLKAAGDKHPAAGLKQDWTEQHAKLAKETDLQKLADGITDLSSRFQLVLFRSDRPAKVNQDQAVDNKPAKVSQYQAVHHQSSQTHHASVYTSQTRISAITANDQ